MTDVHALHQEAMENGVEFSFNDAGNLSVNNDVPVDLMVRLRDARDLLTDMLHCTEHNAVRLPVPSNPNIRRCPECTKGWVEASSVDSNAHLGELVSSMDYRSRVFCPNDCVDDNGMWVVTQKFATGARDGAEIWERVKNAPLCESCLLASKEKPVRKSRGRPRCAHRWVNAESHLGWLQCAECRSYRKGTR